MLLGLALGLAVASSSCVSGRHSMSVSLGSDNEGNPGIETAGVAAPGESANGFYHLVCWNVHKGDDARFVGELGALLEDIPARDEVLLCLQEARSKLAVPLGGSLHRGDDAQ